MILHFVAAHNIHGIKAIAHTDGMLDVTTLGWCHYGHRARVSKKEARSSAVLFEKKGIGICRQQGLAKVGNGTRVSLFEYV